MAETLSLVSVITMVVSGICLLTSIVVFLIFKIPSVIGDLSGRTAKKSLEQMRKEREQQAKRISKIHR